MLTALCVVPICSVRAEPTHQSEMTSQLLFGEGVELLASVDDWVNVRCIYDNFEGWCTMSQLSVTDIDIVRSSVIPLVSTWQGVVMVNDQPMHVPLGSALPGLQNGEARWGKWQIRSSSKLIAEGSLEGAEDFIRQLTFPYLNTAYLWGGRSIYGTDCSGLVQVVYRFFGKKLPRNASLQVHEGNTVDFLQEARCGDLAFFNDGEGNIIHVGILLNDHEIIHAAGKVRIDHIDTAGIVNSDSGMRTHSLRIIKRLF
ncbi:MAG: NlpC/P60 family protein [Bacteroidetes bacterium]|nr:NlpC/P60 family protein [Bacteroidota bacterium]